MDYKKQKHSLKIAVVGAGYVGLSNAVLLSQHNDVVVLDLVPRKIAQLERGESPIEDPELQDYLKNRPLKLRATLDKKLAYENADFVIVATPTDYDPDTNYFETRSIEVVIKDVMAINPAAVVVSVIRGFQPACAPRPAASRASLNQRSNATCQCSSANSHVDIRRSAVLPTDDSCRW